MDELYAATGKPSYAKLVTHAELEEHSISKSTISDVFNRAGMPTWKTVETFVRACLRHARVQRPAKILSTPLDDLGWWESRWLDARASRSTAMENPGLKTSPTTRPIGAWDPFDLAIHRVMNVGAPEGDTSSALPGYLRRDHDAYVDQLLADPQRSVMIVLLGGSSTGKTRTLYEAISRHDLLRNWPLRYPRDAAQLLRTLQSGDVRLQRSVLWLNDLQGHLTGADGPAAAAELQRLLDGDVPGPVVIVGTLWRPQWDEFTSEPLRDLYSQARRLLLHQVKTVEVPEEFTEHQLAALRDDHDADRRLVSAAAAAGSKRLVIQTLTGGPLLVDRYERPHSQNGWYARAVLSAALDARRMGLHRPIPAAVLRAAAPAYLDGDARVDPPENWIAQGIQYLTHDPRHGVTALVGCRGEPGPGPADSYEPHDYLDQHSRVSRCEVAPPAALWQALVDDTHDLDDQQRLANNAESRLLYRYAMPLLRRVADTGDDTARMALAELLVQRGMIGELYERADAGDRWAAMRRAYALVEHGRVDELGVRADSGDQYATMQLADHMFRQDRSQMALDVHRGRADRQGMTAALHEVNELLQQQRAEDAVAILLRRAEQEEHWAAQRLTELCDAEGRYDDEAMQALRSVASTVPGSWAAQQLDRRLAERGDLDELIKRADDGDFIAAGYVPSLLRAADRIDELRRRADDGDTNAIGHLHEWLIEQGHIEEAVNRLRAYTAEAGHTHAEEQLVGVLVELGRLDELRQMADRGNDDAAWSLADLLIDRGDVDTVRCRAEEGDDQAMERLLDWLTHTDKANEALSIMRQQGSALNASLLADWLVEQGRPDEAVELLRHRTFRTQLDELDIIMLGVLLHNLGRSKEQFDVLLDHSRRPGSLACEPLARLLAARRDVDTLREIVVRTGSWAASRCLLDLARQNARPDAMNLLQYGLRPDGSVDGPTETA
ncbi:hypothetical protein [Amycolatopsis sp. NPDC052450]|uniref:hypothetical protein n=1 Tax=Amycolatopsis sp. NPDC052450 TaxID=3363937 RepID=UPI0037C5A2DA